MTPQKNCSYLPITSPGDKRDTGSNSHETEFGQVWKMVMQNYQTLSPELFFSLCKNLDLEAQEIKSLTDKFIRKALRSGTIVQIESCMDSPVYRVV